MIAKKITTLAIIAFLACSLFLIFPVRANSTGNSFWTIGENIDTVTAFDIASLYQTYQQPKIIIDLFWTDNMNNPGSANIYPFISQTALTILQNQGIIVYQHLDCHQWASDGYYSQADLSQAELWVRQTISALPSINGFFIDAAITGNDYSSTSAFTTFYMNLINYVHSEGKLAIINMSGAAIWGNGDAGIREIENAVDTPGIMIEDAGSATINSLYAGHVLTPSIASEYPGKWMSNCWGGSLELSYSGTPNPVPWASVEQATYDSWANGVSYYEGDPTAIENWGFDQHTSNVTSYFSVIYGNQPSPTPTPHGGGGGGGDTIVINPTPTPLVTPKHSSPPVGNSSNPTDLLIFVVAIGFVYVATEKKKKKRRGHR